MKGGPTGRWWPGLGNWPIRYQLLSVLMLAALLPLALFIAIESINTYVNTVERVEVSVQRATQVGAAFVERALERALTEVYSSSRDLRLSSQVAYHARTHNTDPASERVGNLVERTVVILEDHLEEHPLYQAMRLLAPDGSLLAVAGGGALMPALADTAQSEHPAYLQLSAQELPTDSATLLQPYPDPVSGQPVLEAATLVVEGNTLHGYLIFTLDFEQLTSQPLVEVVGGLENEMPGGETLFLVDGEGWLLTPVQGIAPFERRVGPEEGEAGEQETYVRDWGGGPQVVIGGRTAIPGHGWTVIGEANRASILEAQLADLASTSAPTLLLVALLSLALLFLANQMLIRPIQNLTRAALQIAGGDLSAEVPPTRRGDEIGALTSAFASMTEQLRASIGQLEQRVRESTRDLEISAAIGREASALQPPDRLLNGAVNLIVERFPAIYHAQVFLLDEAGQYANLVASTGEAGRALLQRGHRLPVGGGSVIGRATERGETVIVGDTSSSPVHRRNELLPETRAEMALPLVLGKRVLGALDVQSKAANVFTEAEQRTFEMLAAQLAVAIYNARLYAEAERRAAEVETLNRQLTRATWQELLFRPGRRGYLAAAAGPGAAEDGAQAWSPWQREAIRQRQAVLSPPQEDGGCYLAVPILARGEALGAVQWRLPRQQADAHTQQLAQELTARLAMTLESLRLLERSERLAARERLVNRISSRLTEEPNLELVLQTAVRELAEALRLERVSIRLGKPDGSPEHGPTEGRP